MKLNKKLQGDYNLREMIAHLLEEKKEFRLELITTGTIIVYKSLGLLNPVLVDYFLYFDNDGKQFHKPIAI